jgi:hypothetical protein
MSKILIGSQYFFSCYEDFNSKDIDELELVDTDNFKWYRQLSGQGKCLFQFRKLTCAQDYIDYALSCNCGMVVGKFLVPEFCEQIGFTIEQLPQLQPLIDKLDDKHKYEKIIYDSYIRNGSFTLTDGQREKAYQSYKRSRGE